MTSAPKAVMILSLLFHGLTCPGRLRADVPVERDAVRVWIDRAIASTGVMDGAEAESYASYHLARVRGRAGDAAGAFESALRVIEPQRRLYALKYAAEAARKAGNTERCREIVAAGRRAAASDEGSFTTSAFIDVCFSAGFPGEAVEYAGSVSNSAVRHHAYSTIARKYCAHDNREAAERVLRSRIRGGDARDYGRRDMIRGLIAAGDLEAARDLVNNIEDPDVAAQALSDLAEALANAGDVAQAEKLATRVQDGSIRRQLLAEISKIGVEGGPVDRARAKFAAAESREEQMTLLEPLVELLLEVEAFDEADRAVDKVAASIERNPRPAVSSKFGTYGDRAALARVRVLQLVIATKLADRGGSERAAELLEKSDAAIDRLPPESYLVRWLSEVARIRVLLKLDREDEAVERLREMGPDSKSIQSRAATAIAVHLISTGDIERALQITARKTGKDGARANEGLIASALVRRGEMERAVQILNQAGESEEDADAFRDAARDLVEAGQLEKVEALYEALGSPVARAHVAIETAERHLRKESAGR